MKNCDKIDFFKADSNIENDESSSELSFDEKGYDLMLSDITGEREHYKKKALLQVDELKKELSEDEDTILDKINPSVFENVVNPGELKILCKDVFEKGLLEVDENGDLSNVYVYVNGEKKNSELFSSAIRFGYTPEQALRFYLQVRTKAFKNWFGDWESDSNNSSKVVDSNGEPMLLYHSTSTKFDEFDISFFGKTDPGNLGQGFYFSSLLTNGYGKIVLPCFLNIRNPFYTSDEYSQSIACTFGRFGKNVEKQLSYKIQEIESFLNDKKDRLKNGIFKFETQRIKLENDILELEKLLDRLKNQGYDDVVKLNKCDGIIQGGYEFVVENPNQIKGVENNGTYSCETGKFNE